MSWTMIYGWKDAYLFDHFDSWLEFRIWEFDTLLLEAKKKSIHKAMQVNEIKDG